MRNLIYLLLRRMRMPLIVIILAYAVSILGLVLIPGVDDQGQPWHMSIFHAFYFVSFMGSTIGFGEIPYPFSDPQRLWTTTQWGNIRPSWHIECPAIAMKHLGETFDIHTGGADLIFPHHENAIAISQAITGKPPNNYWLHNELVMIDGKKPSRFSKDGAYTIGQILERGYSGSDIRYWLISRHYRKPIAFSWAELDRARKTVSNLDKFIKKLYYCQSGPSHPEMDQMVYDVRRRTVEAMDDDFKVSPALAALFKFTHSINTIMDKNGLSPSDREKVLKALELIDSVLGVMDLEAPGEEKQADSLIKKREEARKMKDWATADALRQELIGLGIEVIDTKKGPVWRKLRD